MARAPCLKTTRESSSWSAPCSRWRSGELWSSSEPSSSTTREAASPRLAPNISTPTATMIQRIPFPAKQEQDTRCTCKGGSDHYGNYLCRISSELEVEFVFGEHCRHRGTEEHNGQSNGMPCHDHRRSKRRDGIERKAERSKPVWVVQRAAVLVRPFGVLTDFIVSIVKHEFETPCFAFDWSQERTSGGAFPGVPLDRELDGVPSVVVSMVVDRTGDRHERLPIHVPSRSNTSSVVPLDIEDVDEKLEIIRPQVLAVIIEGIEKDLDAIVAVQFDIPFYGR